MELREFVSAAITQLVDAVHSTNAAVNTKGASINPCYLTGDEPLNEPIMMEFDVAMIVKEDAAVQGGGSLKVMGVGLGGKASRSANEDTVSHVKFAVPVQLPAGKKLGAFEPPSGVRSRARGDDR
jgi:hypothetical protein